MPDRSYKIRGLDCAEEVAILNREVGPLVGGADRLSFDILKGKMTVREEGEPVDENALIERVASTGMQAERWEEYAAARASGEREPFWQRHGRAVMCGISGAAALVASVYHGLVHGWADAIGQHDAPHTYPTVAIALYVLAVVTGGWYIFPKALYAARRLRPDMNLLMTVAVIGAIILGEWFEAAAVAFLFSLALLLESWSVGRARRAIESLLDLSPEMARVRCPHDGDLEMKPVAEVAVGATVNVRPGERVPLDGEIAEGETSINQAPITGESMPVAKAPGDEVYAGTINGDGAFEFKVTKPATESTLARIIHMVEEAHARRAPSEQWVETFARYYTPAMMLLAIAVAVVPPLFAGGVWSNWIYQGLVILVIACPCALVISTPVSIVAGLASAARHGVLIKGGLYLEAPAGVQVFALDKTGTVTHGKPVVQTIVPLNGHNETELLQRAASLEAHSNHPLAVAIVEEARQKSIDFDAATEHQTIQGKGAQGSYRGRTFWVGSHRFLHEKTAETPECEDAATAMEDAGHSVVAIGNETHVCGLISIADAVRDDAASFVRGLHDAGIEHVAMLTGDNERTAQAVAESIGIDDVRAEVLPEEKVAAVEALRKQYGRVAMIGDGVNDAPAMAAADLSIAMGAAGSDAAIETADIALMSDDLSKAPWLIRHSRRTLRIIKQNIAFALGLKVVFIILAFLGLATLWMAIAADMGASLLVIANGLRLLRA